MRRERNWLPRLYTAIQYVANKERQTYVSTLAARAIHRQSAIQYLFNKDRQTYVSARAAQAV